MAQFTVEQMEVMAECIRMTATMMLTKPRMTDVDKVRILTLGVVLDEVTKEIEHAKAAAAILAGGAPLSGDAPAPDSETTA